MVSPDQARRLEALRKVTRLLDTAIVVPGTTFRIGLDPILGLIPGLGDLVSPLFALAILWQARDLGVPRVVQLRMVFNVAIDALVGVLPFMGDLFDFIWKANAKNMALLERHATGPRGASAGDWLFVAAVIVVLIMTAVLPLLIAGWLLAAIGRRVF